MIKFTTLFGLLAVEIAVMMTNKNLKLGIGIFFLLVALYFVYRSFYNMRIPDEPTGTEGRVVIPRDVGEHPEPGRPKPAVH